MIMMVLKFSKVCKFLVNHFLFTRLQKCEFIDILKINSML